MTTASQSTTRTLGRTGLTVSAIGLGTWPIGGAMHRDGAALGYTGVDDDESLRALATAATSSPDAAAGASSVSASSAIDFLQLCHRLKVSLSLSLSLSRSLVVFLTYPMEALLVSRQRRERGGDTEIDCVVGIQAPISQRLFRVCPRHMTAVPMGAFETQSVSGERFLVYG